MRKSANKALHLTGVSLRSSVYLWDKFASGLAPDPRRFAFNERILDIKTL